MLTVEIQDNHLGSSQIEQLMQFSAPLRDQLINHPLYSSIKSLSSLRTFMEYHIFAVWDFMSLLKTLQNNFSCTNVPWIPRNDSKMTRLINEIVLCEESDQINGSTYSHLEFYILAMKDLGCDTSLITELLKKVGECGSYRQAVDTLPIPNAAKNFMDNTFSIIESNEIVAIATAFTIGREALIPDMFIEIIKGLNHIENINLEKLIIYLERHIEIDGGEHGPLAFQMVNELCQDNNSLWRRASDSALLSLQARIDLWDNILLEITSNNPNSNALLFRPG